MATPSTDFLAILSVRNEGAFLIDWLAHHGAVGFDHALVFSNDSTDGTNEILRRLKNLKKITHIEHSGPFEKGAQWAALRAADSHPRTQAARWIMVIDIDEFVNIHAGGGTLAALVASLPDADAVTLTWRLFGNGGIVHYEDAPPWQQFVRAAPRVMGWPWRAAMFKTLFRSDGRPPRLGVHQPRNGRRDGARWFDGSGRLLGDGQPPSRVFSTYGQDNYALAQLNHYALGSMESYLLKCDRGRANRQASAFDLGYWVERNLVAEEDRSLTDAESPLAARRAALRAELLADPVLGPLHQRAVDWRRNRFETLMLDDRYRELFGRLLMAPASRVPSHSETAYLAAFARRAQLVAERKDGAGSETD